MRQHRDNPCRCPEPTASEQVHAMLDTLAAERDRVARAYSATQADLQRRTHDLLSEARARHERAE